MNITQQLRALGLSGFEGRQHCGIDVSAIYAICVIRTVGIPCRSYRFPFILSSHGNHSHRSDFESLRTHATSRELCKSLRYVVYNFCPTQLLTSLEGGSGWADEAKYSRSTARKLNPLQPAALTRFQFLFFRTQHIPDPRIGSSFPIPPR